MLTGVLCEVISAVSVTEKEKMSVTFVKEKMQTIMQSLDESGDGRMSKGEFVKILDHAEAVKALQEVDVDVVGLVDLAEEVFNGDTDAGEIDLSFADFHQTRR